MRKTFAALAVLLLLVVVAQFFFAATGAFSTAPHEESFRTHHVLGYVIFLVPILMVIVAFPAEVPRRLIGMTALVAGLTSVQVVIAELARAMDDTAGALFFGLHAINGLALLAVTWLVARRAWTLAAADARQTVGESSDPVTATPGRR